jgi:hypothetical protein
VAEWLYEAGIGEARAALVEGDAIVAAAVEPEGTLVVGTVARGRLIELLPRRQGRVAIDGAELLLTAVPAGVTQGAALTVEVTREAIPETGRLKPPRAVASDGVPTAGPDLLARLLATGLPIRRPAAHEADALEAAGWSEVLEEAVSGDIDFSGGALRMSPTPAMTLFDVDGGLDPEALALAGAAAAAAAIRRHGIGGSIGIDFPTLSGKPARQAVAAAIDTGMDWPGAGAFERTSVNGFGFLQLVRPRPRASLPERLRADPVRAAACALLRLLERTPPGQPTGHRVPPPVLRYLEGRPAWLAELARRSGVVHRLEPR